MNENWKNKDVQVMQVIRTYILRKGKGIEGDPIRIIEQFWTLDGELLVENDPYQPTNT